MVRWGNDVWGRGKRISENESCMSEKDSKRGYDKIKGCSICTEAIKEPKF